MGAGALLAATFAATTAALAVPAQGLRWPRGATGHFEAPSALVTQEDPGWLHRRRWLWAGLAGAGGLAFVSGPWGLVVGLAAAIAVWTWIGRVEPVTVRRRREAAARELPGLVQLFATALESGCDVADALRLACAALPGPAADLLAGVPGRLALGLAPETAWRRVLGDAELAPLGRAMVRAHRSGSSVTQEVLRLAEELDRRARLRVEERARTVGVKAAVPLGLCLLPAFLLLGVVPLVAALLASLSL
jgi:Flp pilus assembly protein TadB